jgi:FkbM family methyltransferase
MEYGDGPTFAMTPEEIVEAFYRNCLGRAPSVGCLAHHAATIRSTGDPTVVLQFILESPEYLTRAKSLSVDCVAEREHALSFLNRRLTVVDVGAQSLGIGSHPYINLLEVCGVDVIGFDPLQERLRERAEQEAGPGLTLLPYAVGDGGTHTLYINNEDATSSLFPLNSSSNALFNHLNGLFTVRTEQVVTKRLDDVLPCGPIDFLKLEVQGGELMVLKGAAQTLLRTAVIHCEVSFSPMYVDQALFADVQQHLSSRGFVLIDLFLPGRYHYLTPSGRTVQDRLIWGDAVFFRETDDAETLRVQALVASSIYQKPTLAEHLLHLADQSAGKLDRHTTPRFPGWERTEMTVSCRDSDSIPKVPGAGSIFDGPGGVLCQRMHNGLRVLAEAYQGKWMSEVIRRLRGHHEPQEEALFNAVLPLIESSGSQPVMIELGSFWGYYSLWFKSVCVGGRNILVEPDPGNLQIGRKNFELNGFPAEFLEAAVGVHDASAEFFCESDRTLRLVRTVSVDGLVRDLGLERVHLLHADIQGAELSMLEGAAEAIDRRRLDFLFISTHHHAISGDPLTHQRCLDWLKEHGAFLVDEHSVSESFSGDGLIVAAFGRQPQLSYKQITRNRASRSLFRETEYDLAEAWKEIERLRNAAD